MGPDNKAQELRALLGLAIKLRKFVASSRCEEADLFLSAAEALESRAHRRAYNLIDDGERIYSAEA
jgi:hypothetical protein